MKKMKHYACYMYFHFHKYMYTVDAKYDLENVNIHSHQISFWILTHQALEPCKQHLQNKKKSNNILAVLQSIGM